MVTQTTPPYTDKLGVATHFCPTANTKLSAPVMTSIIIGIIVEADRHHNARGAILTLIGGGGEREREREKRREMRGREVGGERDREEGRRRGKEEETY